MLYIAKTIKYGTHIWKEKKRIKIHQYIQNQHKIA